jgi:hypothetical protein
VLEQPVVDSPLLQKLVSLCALINPVRTKLSQTA